MIEIEELDKLISKSEKSCCNCRYMDGDLCSRKTKTVVDPVIGEERIIYCSTCSNERDSVTYQGPALVAAFFSVLFGVIPLTAASANGGKALAAIVAVAIFSIPAIIYFWIRSLMCGPSGRFWFPKEDHDTDTAERERHT